MWAARGRWSGLSLLLMLLVALLACCPVHAAGNSGVVWKGAPGPVDLDDTDTIAANADRAAEEPDIVPPATDKPETEPPTTEEPTTAPPTTAEPTTAPPTTSEPTTGSTTTSEPGTASTSDSSPETTNPSETTTPADTTTTTTTTPGQIDDLDLYESTQDALTVTEGVLANFSSLVSSGIATRTKGILDRPAGWWRLNKAQTKEESVTINEFCKDTSENSECEGLREDLDVVQKLATRLAINVDDWRLADLENLKARNEELKSACNIANANKVAFKAAIDVEAFQGVIDETENDVKASKNAVGTKIDTIKADRTGSVVLVAVLGSVGGIMIVALAGVMVYGAVKKQKTKKKSSTTPYNKLQGENIPIDAFVSDAPPRDLSHIPRADPYANHQQPRSDPYASSYGGRSEPPSEYRGQPRITRVGKALPRTHF